MLHSVNAHFPSIGATETSFSLHVSATSLRACLDAHVSTSIYVDWSGLVWILN